MTCQFYLGTAGWALPKTVQPVFPPPESGSGLQRYATRFPAVEVNSSFYRLHRDSTYARWADSVPPGFRFSVKIPRTITHDHRLFNVDALLDEFLAGVAALGDKLGCLLVQLPPSLAFAEDTATRFFTALRARHDGAVVFEPRHASWFPSAAVAHLLEEHHIARVAADPAPVPAAAWPAGHSPVVYYRLHGSPHMYYSSYTDTYLDDLAVKLKAAGAYAGQVWCILDNTAEGAATVNALDLLARLGG